MSLLFVSLGFGTSCILRYLCLEDLVKTLEANLKPGPSNVYNISLIEFEMWDETEDKTVKPPLKNFTELNPTSAILRATYSEQNEKYHLEAGKQTIPNLIMTLGLSKLYETGDWGSDHLDKMLETGDKHYNECMMKMREGKLLGNVEPTTIMEVEEEEAAPVPQPQAAPSGKKARGM